MVLDSQMTHAAGPELSVVLYVFSNRSCADNKDERLVVTALVDLQIDATAKYLQ